MEELEIGTKVKDRYVLKKLQGRGGFGEVWLAYDEILESDVAVKLYISLDSQGIEEFKSEYTTAQELHHPNLLTPSYLDIWQHRPFLVMKYCAKGSAANFVGKMDERMLWQFIHDVAAGLNHLHSLPEPIVHQDIKPYNVLVDDSDRFLITDFGISKKIRSTMRKQSSRATGAGATAYMGPERFEANPEPIMASDIWSLGASIYEIATGELPFSGFGGGMQKNGAEIPSLDGNWSGEMNMVMQSCLAKETWERPTASQLEEYTAALLKGREAKPAWRKETPAPVGGETGGVGKTVPVGGGGDNNGNNGNGGNGGGDGSNKWLVWVIVAVVVVGVIVLVVALSGRKVPPAPPAPKSPVETIENPASPKVEGSDKTEVEEQKTNEERLTPIKPKTDENAEALKNALSRGDYQEVLRLANQNYAPAYGPLAKHYLSQRNYDLAERYAKKAKAAGYKEGDEVLNTLTKLGYYD